MNEQLKILIELQTVDGRREELQSRLATIPGQLEHLRSGYRREQQALDDIKASLEAITKERRTAERELETQEEKIRKLKEQQFMVKSNKEFQTMNHEIQVMENKKGSLEETILLMMEMAGDAEKKIKAQEKGLVQEKEVFQGDEQTLQEVEASLTAELAEANRERELILGRVTPENLHTYSRIREFRHGKAVAGVIEGICQGCSIALRPQKYQEVKSNEEILTCDECKRIIYYQQDPQNADQPPASPQD